MRIAVICNDRIALPALDFLLGSSMTVSVAMTDRINEISLIVKSKCLQAGVPVHYFSKKNFEQELLSWLDHYRPDVVLVKTFPFLIPASALSIPRYGFINFHYAPLPAW